MAGFTGSSPEDTISEIRRNFAEIPKETLTAVDSKSITRVKWTIEHKREYYHTD
jgi:hypothetical protein